MCRFCCGKPSTQSRAQAERGFCPPRGVSHDCLQPLCMLGLFMSLVDGAAGGSPARNWPKISHKLPLLLSGPKTEQRHIQPHGGNNASKDFDYKTGSFKAAVTKSKRPDSWTEGLLSFLDRLAFAFSISSPQLVLSSSFALLNCLSGSVFLSV